MKILDSNERRAGGRTGRPPSPCINVCTLDESDVCQGCGRSLAQIAGWTSMSASEQWSVIDELMARKVVNTGTIAAGN